MRKHLLKTVIIFIAFLMNTGFAAKRDAVVKIICRSNDGSILTGSGVCVSHNGIVLTVTHVVRDGSCEVLFGGRKYSVVDSMIPKKEGVAILKVRAAYPFPYLEIADTSPKKNEIVWIMGYPRSQWKTLHTIVTVEDAWFRDDPSTRLIGVQSPAYPGTSGGPLVTKDWKVAGICSVSDKLPPQYYRSTNPNNFARVSGQTDDTGGMYISLQHIKTAYAAYVGRKVQKKPVLYVLTGSGCIYCSNFERDVKKGKFDGYEVVTVKDRKLWEVTTGDYNPQMIPRFYIKGGNRKPVVGYDGSPGLLQILGSIVKGIGGLIFNPKAEPKGSPFRQPETPKLVDSSNQPEPPEFEDSPTPSIVPKEIENTELKDIKSDIANVLNDIKTLKDGNAFQKLPALLSLKKDVALLKDDGKDISLKINNAKAELDTIRDVAKQDIMGLKSAITVLKDEDASKIQKAIAIAPAVKKAVSDAKYLKNWLGDPKSDINGLLLLVGGLLGSIKGYKQVRG